jgi:hypothetical protein
LNVPSHTEQLLEDLANALQVADSRYEAAERSYTSLGTWLGRPESSLREADPDVYIQGSFRLGTAIRPASNDEDYDVDLVCELSLSKSQLSQMQLKQALGAEIELYAKAHSMHPPEEGRRCWTLNYADGAQFHLDTLPSIPDGARTRLLLENRGLDSAFADTAIAITDKDHPSFRQLTNEWPHSNPKGYAAWFHSRMAAAFAARRNALALEAKSSVEEIPEYRVRTPLQNAVQILKHHRDVMFAGRSDDKPISIILSTLSAHAYENEPSIAAALYSILAKMDQFIENRNGVDWIANPTDGRENFADRWPSHPERREAFFEWLAQARFDFREAALAANRSAAAEALQPRLGDSVFKATADRNSPLKRVARRARRAVKSLNPRHKKAPPWTAVDHGCVTIRRALRLANGFRPTAFASDGPVLPKRTSLVFEAETDIPKPYRVYWQVVNTGPEAEAANGLRGGFDEGTVTSGYLKRQESTLYAGTHSIECFIVKQGYLAARSGQFIVNIQ